MPKLSVLRELIRESLLLEDRIQDLINSDTTGNLWSAKELGVTHVGGLTWLKSMVDKRLVGDQGEPIADVAPVVVSFFKQGMSDRLAQAGMPTDIMRYKNPGELRQTITALGASKGEKKKAVKKGETDVAYESDKFLVVMPHSVASSCFYGKGTTWCTAATEDQNLFLSYVGSGRGVILYYILKKGADSVADPTAKISLATVKGKPHFSSQSGGLSVDAKNAGLTQEKFNSILGDEADPVLDAIVSHSAKLGNTHPAAKQVEQAVTDLNTWRSTTDKLDKDAYNDFIRFSFAGRAPIREILDAVLQDPRSDKNIRFYVYSSPNFDPNALLDLLENADDMWDRDASEILHGITGNTSVTYEQLQRVFEIISTKKNGQHVTNGLLRHPSIPSDVLIEKFKNTNQDTAIRYIAQNPSLPDDFIKQELHKALHRSSTKSRQLISAIIDYPKAHPQYQRIVWDSFGNLSDRSYDIGAFQAKVAKTLATITDDEQLLIDVANYLTKQCRSNYLSKDEQLATRSIIINTNTPNNIIEELAASSRDDLVRMMAQARIKDPEFDAEAFIEEYEKENPDEFEED